MNQYCYVIWIGLAVVAGLAILGLIIYGFYYGIRECHGGDEEACLGIFSFLGPVVMIVCIEICRRY